MSYSPRRPRRGLYPLWLPGNGGGPAIASGSSGSLTRLTGEFDPILPPCTTRRLAHGRVYYSRSQRGKDSRESPWVSNETRVTAPETTSEISLNELSRNIRAHIAAFAEGKVLSIAGENYAAIPTVDQSGSERVYRIIFSLTRFKGLPVHRHLRIESAHPADSASFATFGSVRLKHLVALRAENKRPGRIVSPNRKAPRVF